MAYFGKEYAFEREENFEEFINALGLPEEEAAGFANYKPNQKIDKDGDGYIITFLNSNGPKEVKFNVDESVQETVRDDIECVTTFSIDGDTVTQVQDYGDRGSITYKREYSEDALKVTITSSKWDGVASRYYVAV